MTNADSNQLGGAYPNGQVGVAQRSLFLTVRDATMVVVTKCLAKGLADPTAVFPPYCQDLMFFAAARRGELGGAETVAKQLFDLGVPATTEDSLCQTPLFYAAREGNVECARFLVEHDCDPNKRDIHMQTPIFYAVREGRSRMTEFLIEKGASLDVFDARGLTPHDYVSKRPPTKRRRLDPRPQPQLSKTRVATKSINTPQTRKKQAGVTDDAWRNSSEAHLDAWGRWLSGPSPSPDAGESHLRLKVRWWHAPSGENFSGEPKLEDADILARAGDYYVRRPILEDVPKLRELERQFVKDHFDLFQGEPWAKKQAVSDWCALVGVIWDEVSAHQAIQNIINGGNAMHSSLPCIYAPCGQEPEVIGYLHTVHDLEKSEIDVSHLKVDSRHQGRRLGSLLIAGAARHALRQTWKVQRLCLSVMEANVRAIRLYRRIGFKEMESLTRKKVRWLRMHTGLSADAIGNAEGWASECESLCAACL